VSFKTTRRNLLRDSVQFGAGGIVVLPFLEQLLAEEPGKQPAEPEVTATEDLMREHGVIRRALLVYYELVPKLRKNSAQVNAVAVQRTARLFRTFGEDYHERMLEEQHIFPLIRKQSKAMSVYVDTLIEQHNRGREITEYVLAVTKAGKISAAHAEPLAKVFESFTLMYENHAAREDTIIFPAWKKNFSNQQLDAISDQFEDIEHKMFGKDGFEDAEKQISAIEESLGFADLGQFTPPPPPKL